MSTRTTDLRKKGFAVVFTVIMVLSMVAMGTSGAGLAAPAEDEVAASGDLVQDIAEVEIDDELYEADGTTEVIVRLDRFDGTLGTEGDTALRSHAEAAQAGFVEFAGETNGIEVKRQFWIANAVLVEVDTEAVDIEDLARVEGVTELHPNYEIELVDPIEADSEDGFPASTDDVGAEGSHYTYGLEQINAPTVWDEFDVRGEGASVAVLDTGVDPDHPDIDIEPENFQEFDVEGNPVDSDPHDTHGHGTHVSGTVVGGDASGTHIGVAPNAELMHGLILPGGSGSFAQIIAGIEWAVDEDADVVSMSFGIEGQEPAMIEPIENAVDAGTLAVASAGNEGDGLSSTPGNLYSSLNLGATDENENVATFSSGEVIHTETDWDGEAPDYWPEEYVVPSVAAPGVDVKSAQIGGGYTDMSGTSMSAPHAAGTAALMITAAGGEMDPWEIHDVLEDHAWKPEDWDEPDDEPDTRYGYGIIDAYASVDDVAAESGIEGHVTDVDTGDGVPHAEVRTESSLLTFADDDGAYQLYALPRTYDIHADAFGYEPSDPVTVDVPDNETFVEQDFELDPRFEVALERDQPEEMLSGDAFTIEVMAGHVEEVTIENVGDFDEEHAHIFVDGEPVEFGESHEFDERFYGPLEITIEIEEGFGGTLELQHTFEGLGESAMVTTGPTNIVADPFDIALVATEADDAAHDFADSLTRTDALLGEPAVLTPETAIEEVDEYDVLVLHSLNDDIEGLDNTNELFEVARTERVGTVVLDQQGSGANAKSVLSEARGYPGLVDYPGTLIIGAPSWYAGIENPDHPFWEDVEFDNITTLPPDFIRYDDTEWSTTHYAGFDGETEAQAGQFFTPTGPSVGVDDPRGVTLFGSMGYAGAIGAEDYEDDAYRAVANAVLYNTEVNETEAFMTEEPAMRHDPGETLESIFEVEGLERVKTELTEESTIDEGDLSLYHGTQINAFGEWRAFEPPRDTDDFSIRVETPTDETGIVELRHTLRVERDDGSTREFVVTTRTSVFEEPLRVPEDADTIDEAIDMSVPHTEIVIADGTYEEQLIVPFDAPGYNLTIRGEEGATPTIQAPDDLGPDNGVIEIQQRHTTLENLRIEGHQFVDEEEIEPGDYPFDPNQDPVVEVEDDALDELQWGIVAGVTGGDIPTDFTTIRNVEVANVDVGIQFGGLLAGSDSNHNLVDNATVTDAGYIGIVAGTPPDEVFITDSAHTTIQNSHVEDAPIGMMGDSRHSDYVVIQNNTIEDVWFGAGQDGNNRATIVDNEIRNADVGAIWNQGGQQGIYEGNHIENAEYGVVMGGDWHLNGYRVIQIRYNEFVDTDTGVFTGNHDWATFVPHPVWIHYNDFEHADVAVHNEREGDYFSNVDARLNWFGPTGESEIVHDPEENEVLYDPHLTDHVHEVDDEDTREFATTLELEAGGAYTVGVPGPVSANVTEAFGHEFEGVVYGFDAEDRGWELVSGDDSLSTLDGLYVAPEEDTTVQLSFYHGEDATPSPGQAPLEEGWNFVGASQLTGIEEAYGVTSAEPAMGLGVFDRPHSPLTAQQGELTGTYVFGSDEHGPTVSPFEGSFIYAEDDGLVPGHLTHNPSVDQLYEQLNVEPRNDVQPTFNWPGHVPWEDFSPFDDDIDADAEAEEAIRTAAEEAIRAHEPEEAPVLEAAAVAEEAGLEVADLYGVEEEEAREIVQELLHDVFGDELSTGDVQYELLVPDEFAEYEEVELDEESSEDVAGIEGVTTQNDVVDVAILDGHWAEEGAELADTLDDHLEDDEYQVHHLTDTELFHEMGLDEAEDEFDVFVANVIGDLWGDPDTGEEEVEAFYEMASQAEIGVIYLDSEQPYAISEISDVVGQPGDTDGWWGSPDAFFELTDDHDLFEGVGEAGDEVTAHDADTGEVGWFEDYDGDVIAYAGDGTGVRGDGIAVHTARQEVLISTATRDHFVGDEQFTDDANLILANAVEWVSGDLAEPIAWPDPQIAPGENAAWTLETPPVEKIQVDIHEESTVDEDDLELYIDGGVNSFGEWRAYEPPREGNLPFHVSTTEDTVGKIVLEVTVDTTVTDEYTTFTTDAVAVYDPPLTVPGTVDTIQEAVDLAPGDGRTVYLEGGTYEEQVDVTTPDLTLTSLEDEDATIVAPDDAEDGAVLTVDADGVTVDDIHVDGDTDHEPLHGLQASDTHGLTVTATAVTDADAGVATDGVDDVTVSDVDVEAASTAVSIDDAHGVRVAEVNATDVDRGVHLGETTDSTLDGLTVLDAEDGIHTSHAEETAVTDLYVAEADAGLIAEHSHVHLEHAMLDEVGTGVHYADSAGVVTDATVAGDTGLELTDVADEDVWLHFNDLSATETGVHADVDDTVDVRMNYLGHGTAGTAVTGEVVHQPFLTAPPEEIDDGLATHDIGVEVTFEAGDTYAMGVPGHTTQQVGEVFDDEFEGVAYGFDAETQNWQHVTADDELETLDAFAIVAESDGTAVLEFRDEGPSAPGTTDLEAGWNFVGSPLYADIETAFDVGSAEVAMAMGLFEQPHGQLGPAGELEGTYAFGLADEPPHVSAFEGYFVFVEDDGHVPSYLHSDVTMEQLYTLLGLDPNIYTDDLDAEPPESLTVEKEETTDEQPSVATPPLIG